MTSRPQLARDLLDAHRNAPEAIATPYSALHIDLAFACDEDNSDYPEGRLYLRIVSDLKDSPERRDELLCPVLDFLKEDATDLIDASAVTVLTRDYPSRAGEFEEPAFLKFARAM